MTYTKQWTLEGTESNDYRIDVEVEFSFRFGSMDSWMEPGDPPEAEIEECYIDSDEPYDPIIKWAGSFSLTPDEEEKVLADIFDNPPEPPSFEDDY